MIKVAEITRSLTYKGFYMQMGTTALYLNEKRHIASPPLPRLTKEQCRMSTGLRLATHSHDNSLMLKLQNKVTLNLSKTAFPKIHIPVAQAQMPPAAAMTKFYSKIALVHDSREAKCKLVQVVPPCRRHSQRLSF